MRVLIACERFGVIRDAFRARGHEAWSCDLAPDAKGSPFHFQQDIFTLLEEVSAIRNEFPVDLMIAHPDCTHLAVSGARYFAEKRADGRQQAAIDFFMRLMNADERYGIPRIAVENPIGIMSNLYRKPDQIIQPWQFGHPESKATCLWLKNLPVLQPTNILQKPACGYWDNQTPSGQNKLGPSPERAMKRAATYQGWADAMAEQWSRVAKKVPLVRKSCSDTSSRSEYI